MTNVGIIVILSIVGLLILIAAARAYNWSTKNAAIEALSYNKSVVARSGSRGR